MLNNMREELRNKCDEIDNARTETRIRFETEMTLLQGQKDYLEKLILDIDDYHHKLVENVEEKETSDNSDKGVKCYSCHHYKNITGECRLEVFPKNKAINCLDFYCDKYNVKLDL